MESASYYESSSIVSSSSFEDIIGHEEVKMKMKQVLQPFLLPEHIVQRVFVGIRASVSSILLYGPPGCGKTKLAQAMATYLDAAFFTVAPGDVLSSNMGESEQNIRGIFDQAVQMGMTTGICLLFFDEIDAIGQSRDDMKGGGDGNNCSRRVLIELMLQLNQLSQVNHIVTTNDNESVRIFVVGATNHRHDCDAALLRRFGSQIYVGLPKTSDRLHIVLKLLYGIPHSMSIEQLDSIAEWTEGFSGSDLEAFVREASYVPIHECMAKADEVRSRLEADHKQAVGDSSSEVDEIIGEGTGFAPDPEVAAREALIREYERLRPVTFSDMCQAFNHHCATRNLDRVIANPHDLPIVSPTPTQSMEGYDMIE